MDWWEQKLGPLQYSKPSIACCLGSGVLYEARSRALEDLVFALEAFLVNLVQQWNADVAWDVLYKVFFTIFYYCPFEIRQTSYFCPIYPIFQPMCIFLHISFCTLNSVTIVMIVKWSLITFLFRIVCRISCALISSLIEMLRPMLSTQAQQGIHIIVV